MVSLGILESIVNLTQNWHRANASDAMICPLLSWLSASIQLSKHTSKGVVDQNAISQGKKLLKPVNFGIAFSISTQLSAPQITAQMVMPMILSNSCFLLRSIRESSKVVKCSSSVAGVEVIRHKRFKSKILSRISPVSTLYFRCVCPDASG